jgi:hypothetical protein
MKRAGAKIIKMPLRQRLVCSECGADGEGTCHCGAAYVPAGQRAAEAVAANPGKSNRTIAKEIGADEQTVRAARQTGTAGHPAVLEAQGLRGPDGVIRRQGRDGKWRKLPEPKKIEIEPELPEAKLVPTHHYDHASAKRSERWQFSLMTYAGETLSMPAAWTREFGKWDKFDATSDLVTLAEQAAAVWQQLASDLKGRVK